MARWMAAAIVAALVAACAGEGEPPERALAPEDRGGGGGGGAATSAPAPQPAVVRAPDLPDLVERVKLAVVNLDTVESSGAPDEELFRRFFGGAAPELQPRRGVGSGFVLRPDGLIVTNNHVVQGASGLTVTFADGRKLPGRIVGADPLTDLALVRVNARGLRTLPLADARALRVGESVVAMGSPLGLSHSVTAGIISAINRDISLNARVGFLQTDAPINPGNSGGPLLNMRGEVVGVNAAVAAAAQGIGFAIPVDTLQAILPQLEREGRVRHAWLGVGAIDLPDDRSRMPGVPAEGVLIGRVQRGSPAAKAGLRPGDVITALDGRPVTDAASLVRTVARLEVGSRTELEIVRDGRRLRVPLVLEAIPSSLAGA